MARLKQLYQDNSGQDIAEYALLLSVIVLVALAAVTMIATNANSAFSRAASALAEIIH